MKLTINQYFDDENGQFVCEKFYVDGQEISEQEYIEMLDTLDIPEEDNCECDGCPDYDKCHSDEPQDFLHVVTDMVNETLEMFDNPTTCEDCKAHALLDLVMLGADGALQGCIGRKEEVDGSLN